MPYQPRIAIVGAGPSGLTLGLLLHKSGIATTIYDLRPEPTDEELAQPSGVLDLHEGSGLAAIRECGLMDEFLPLTGDCTEAMKISDKDANILWADDGDMDFRPEIPRHALTGLLLKHVPSEYIRWNHKILSVTSSTAAAGNTEITIDIGAEGKETFDFVIGADGAWSKVRDIFTAVKPHYSGTQYIMATATQITTKHPQLAEYVGSGSLFALGDRKGVVTHRGVQDSVRLDIVFEQDEDFAKTSGWANKTYAEAKEALLTDKTMFADWSPTVRELLAVGFDEEVARKAEAKVDIKSLYMLPIGHSWETKPGATLIGDAAHLMTPWAGEGVNLAMWDSLDLSKVLIKASQAQAETALSYQNVVGPLINIFEKKMQRRAKGTAEETWRNKQLILGDDGATAMANVFRGYARFQWVFGVFGRISSYFSTKSSSS